MFKAVIMYLVQVIQFLVIGRVVMSWVSQDYRNPLVRFFYQTTEPIIGPIRELITKLGIGGGMFDFSPLIAILILNLVASFVARL